MRIIICLNILYFFCTPIAFSQTNPGFDYTTLLKELEESAVSGNKKALRDLATLVDKPLLRQKVIQIFKRVSLFSKEEFNFDGKFKKKDLLAFYYQNEKQFQFSELVNLFFLSSFEDRKVEYKTQPLENQGRDKAILLRSYIHRLTENLEANPYVDISPQLRDIANLKRPEGFQFILELIEDKRVRKLKKKDKSIIHLHIAQSLATYPSIESLDAVLEMLDNHLIQGVDAKPLLEQICNLTAPSEESASLSDYYRNLVDSLGTLEIIRTFGYEQGFNFRMSFFERSVDYFGKILNLSDKNSTFRINASRDLIETYHSRSLFYLATQVYKYWYKDTELAQSYLRQIELLTQLKVGFKEKGGDFQYDYQAGASEGIAATISAILVEAS